MYPKKLSFSTFFIVLCAIMFSCSLSLNAQTDSLQGKSYEELEELYKIERHNNPTIAKVYAEIMYQQSKQKNDTKRIAQSLFKKATLSYNLGIYDSAVHYTDTSLKFGKQFSNDSLILQNYCLKGNIASISGDYKTAINNYLSAKDLADKMGNLRDVLLISHNIGFIKKQTKDLVEASIIFKENLNIIRKNSLKDFSWLEVASLAFLSDTYLRMKDYNTAETYTVEGLTLVNKNKYNTLYIYLNANNIIIQFHRKQYKKSIASSKSIIESITNFGNDQSLTTPYLYIGKSYLKLKEYDSAIVYFKKFENIVTEMEVDTPEIEGVYRFLAICYANIGEKQNNILYLNKYANLNNKNDSINISINNKIHKEHDIIPLQKEITSLTNDKIKQEKKANYMYITSFGLALSLIGLFFYYKKREVKKEKRFQELLLVYKEKQIIPKQKKKILKSSKIKEDTTENILLALDNFEIQHKYLLKNLTLSILAKKLKTNPKYLSSTINKYKKKSFPHYINDLRIDYIIDQLHENKTYQKYTIKAIANEVGFGNTESFSKAFYKKTGLNPSYYIKQLSKIEDEQ